MRLKKAFHQPEVCPVWASLDTAWLESIHKVRHSPSKKATVGQATLSMASPGMQIPLCECHIGSYTSQKRICCTEKMRRTWLAKLFLTAYLYHKRNSNFANWSASLNHQGRPIIPVFIITIEYPYLGHLRLLRWGISWQLPLYRESPPSDIDNGFSAICSGAKLKAPLALALWLVTV